jgi:hypothetical protein
MKQSPDQMRLRWNVAFVDSVLLPVIMATPFFGNDAIVWN